MIVICNVFPDVKRQIRNLERRQDDSFWLQTSSDKFYPDFVAELRGCAAARVDGVGRDSVACFWGD